MNTKINRKNKWLAGLSFIICNLSFSVALTSCDENFDDWAAPQANGPENAITVPGFTASAVGAQDLAKAGDAVPMFMLNIPALPEGFETGNVRVELTPKGIDDPTTVIMKSTIDGTAPKDVLQELIETTYGKRPTARLFNAHVLVNAIKDGQAVYIDAGNVEVSITPEAPYIAPAYFIVGGAQDWAGSAASKEQRFNHSNLDVYEDPVFTIVIDAAASGDTWFAIGDEAALDAITNDGDWTKLMGCVSGDNTATTGSLDYRYNMGADNSFCVKEGPKKIKVTINMIEYTYEITPVNIADNYYLIGGPGAWDSSKNQKFSHSDKDVTEDPVFTYVFAGSGSDMWFAFGDDQAIDAVGQGDWNQLFGTKGESTDLSGSFDRRYNLGGDHSFCVDGKAKFYRFSINMAEMTYTITPLNFAEYFYEIGNESGWSTSHPLYGSAGDGKYQGYYFLDGEYKFKPNEGDWNDDLEYVGGDAMSGTLQSSGGPNCPDPGAGFYQINLDAAALTFNLVKIEAVGIIGDFNGWGGDIDMTYNREAGCWETTAEIPSDGGLKFRANHDWAINWGGETVDNLWQDGPNISVAAGTYTFQLYVSYAGNHHVVITKQ